MTSVRNPSCVKSSKQRSRDAPRYRSASGVELDRHIRPDAHQLAALPRIVRVREQGLAVPLLRHSPRRARAARRAIRTCAIRSRAPFSPMPGTPLMLSIESPISARTSTTCVRRDAELLLHAFGVVPRAFVARVVDLEAVVHELKEVLVARDDRDLEALGDGLRRQRADDVVGLEAFVGEDRHAERFARLVDPRDLLGEIGRHRRAVGLVVGRHVGRGTSGRRDRTRRRCTAAGDPESACAAS